MSLPMKITKPTRRVRCHVPGCKNRDAYKITRRNDVNGNPLYLCEECIKDIGLEFDLTPKAKRTKQKDESDEIEQAVLEETREIVSEKIEQADKKGNKKD